MVSPNLHRRRLLCGLSFALLIAASGSAAGAAAVPAAAQPSSGVVARQAVPSGNLIDALARVLHLDRVVFYLRGIMPDAQLVYDWSPDDPSQWPGREDASTGGGGLFGDDQDSSFLWGGSTLEVVRTSAMYMTRPANFGPRITVDEGLRGSLIPIAEFYSPPSPSKLKLGTKRLPDNTACPYPGGPGWHDDGNEGPKVTFTKASRGVRPPEDWIALVERGGNCSFAAKVRVSMALGAQAVVVGDAPNPNWKGSDDPSDNSDPGLTNKRPLTMFAPGDTSDVNITSTFVTRPSYLDLLRLIDEVEAERRVANRPSRADSSNNKRGLEIVLARNDISWEWPLIDLALLLLLLPSVMTVASIIVHRIRVARQRRKDRAPETVVLALPCLIWRSDGQPWEKATGKDDGDLNFSSSKASHADSSGSDTAGETSRAGPSSGSGPPRVSVAPAAPGSSHAFLPAGRAYYGSECTICLSDFQDGDRVRVLPCGHIFHRSEIDDWLIRIRKTCPLCSRDCTVAVPPMPIIAQDVQPEIGAGAGASAVLESVVVDEQASEAAPADERTPLLDSRTRS